MNVRAIEHSEFEVARQLLILNGWQDRVGDAEDFRKLCGRSQVVLVAVEGGEILGFLRALSDGISNGYIAMVVVAQQHRGKGVGRALVQAAMAGAANMTWVLRAGRPGVSGFYEKLGFTRSSVAMERPREKSADL